MSETQVEDNNSKITRLKMGTIGAPDLAPIEQWYGEWLGYGVVERGEVAANLAASWGAPDVAGRPYIVMQPESGADVFIRAVENDEVPAIAAGSISFTRIRASHFACTLGTV